MTIRVSVPRKLKPLLAPCRYKGAYGGRGGAKSHFFAEQAILRCYARPSRIVCIREIQNSIKDSVRQLLLDKIQALGLGEWFESLESEIRGPDGSLIIFKGMQSYNADNIKSLEGYHIAWVEEAQTLSSHSLELLRPTMRQSGSEMWFSWNPRYKTDPVDQFFRGKAAVDDPDIASVCINWRDNPWFPDELRKDMERDFRTDPDKAEHIWNGAYGSSQGAILARWVNEADRQGRITKDVLYDPDGAPVELSSDIGFHDTATWWFWQPRLGGFALIDYVDGNGMDAADWFEPLDEKLKGRKLGTIWLPQDAKAKTFQSKHSAVEQFILHYGRQHIGVVPPAKIPDRINAARTVLPRCEFHVERCEKGLDGLRAWEFEWLDDNNVFSRIPVHNWASHPADGFSYGCQIMSERVLPLIKPTTAEIIAKAAAHKTTFNEAIKRQEQREVRRARV